MRLGPETVAILLSELRETGTVAPSYVQQCETLRKALEETARPDPTLTFPTVLATLYPDTAPATAMERFRIWRSRLNRRLDASDAGFQLSVSQSRRLPLEERLFWFEGEDPTVATFNEFSGAEARLERPIQPARGRPETVTYFVSQAHADADAVDSLLRRLNVRLSRIGDFNFVPWRDVDNMVPGESIADEVEEAIDTCSMGLQLISYEYMNSDFISRYERPRFAAGKTLASDASLRLGFPIALYRPDFENGNWEEFGRNKRGVFLHDGRAYQDLREGDHEVRERNRDAFADACVRKIVQAAQRYLGGPESDQTSSERLTDEAMRETLSSGFVADYIPARGHQVPMHRTYRSGPDDALPEVLGIPVVEHLLNWVTMRRSIPLFALLGEYGMGKTVNCKQLTLTLLEQRNRADPDGPCPPMPVYLDMRYARGLLQSDTTQQGSRRFEAVEIDDLVNAIFRGSWKSRETPDAADLRRLIAGGNVLIVFDGFDEVAAHLHPDEAQSLIRTMWSLLPAEALGPDVERRPTGASAVQILISCRTHYFRDVGQQVNLFTGHQRDLEHGAQFYDAMTMLPFSEKQIERFLAAKLDDEGKARRALDTIRSVHNLSELAQRPVLLDQICGQLGQIEALAAAGERINAARLYDLFADEWLARDNAKHTFDVEIKKTLMAGLAGAMWRSGERMWPPREVEEWLDGKLRGDPRINERYADLYRGKAREILHEDLRTSTFLVRSDDKGFRFAHTSILEYFLAKHLFQTLCEREANSWEGIEPSPECLEFLAEIACENARERDKRRFFDELRKLLRHRYRPGISEVAFRIVLDAQRRKETAAPRGRYRLEGAKLSGWDIRRRDGDAPIDLSGSDFTGAVLTNMQIADVAARDCVFDGATLHFVCFERVDLSGGSFKEVRARASIFRHCPMKRIRDAGAAWRRTTFIHCGGLDKLSGSEEGPGGPLAVPGNDCGTFDTDCESWRLEAQLTTTSASGKCAYSPDGTRVVSRGYGSTLRLWDGETGEKIAILKGHKGPIIACAFSPDGRRIVSGSDDRTLRLWDGKTGEKIAVLKGHKGAVLACAFSPDGTRIVSGSSDGTIRLWDAATSAELTVLQGHADPIGICAYSPDGARIVSGSDDGTLSLWSAETGEKIAVLHGHTDLIATCAYSPDGTRIVSGSNDGMLRLWEAETGEELAVLQGHENGILACVFSPDGARVVSGSNDGTVRLWSVETGEELAVLSVRTSGGPIFSYSPEGTRIVSGFGDSLHLRDAETGEAIAVLQDRSGYGIKNCAFSPDGMRIVSMLGDGTVRLWNGETGEELVTLPGHVGWVAALAFSPDGKHIVSGSNDGTLHLWDTETARELAALKGHTRGVSACAYSPEGTRIVSGSHDSTLYLWDGQSGDKIAALQGHTSGAVACRFSRDGSRILSAGYDSFRLWDGKTGEELTVSRGHTDLVGPCVFSPDGTRAVSGDLNMPSLWDVENSREIAVLRGHNATVLACAVSPDGTRIATGSHDAFRLWDGETGQEIAILEGHTQGVWTCAFSPDGTRLVSGGGDGLRLWDVKTGEEIPVLRDCTEQVRSCAFSADGTLVVSGSEDGTVRLCDGESLEKVVVFEGHNGGVLTCAFSPDGTRVASGSNDRTLRLWNVESAEAMAVFYHLPDGGFLVECPSETRILGASGNAWRYFRWSAPNRNPHQLFPLEADPRIGAMPQVGYRIEQ